ncbi:AP-1 complex subunit gamma-2 [Glycine max]|nr:AP-1 complex subunit gamma-2 [Glycine max]
MVYLGLMLLLDERQDVLMLVTNSLKQDLNHTNQYIVGLALCALGNICSAEMAHDLAPEVERLLHFRDPNIRKKAALCSARIIKKVPDSAENFVNPATALLREKHHGVMITGVQLCTELCKISSEALEHVRKTTACAPLLRRKRPLEEYYVTELDAVDVVEVALKHHASDLTTKQWLWRIREIIVQCKGNLVLELQQRSIEFNLIIAKHQNIRHTLVERMPVLDEATFLARRAGSLPDVALTSTGPSVGLPNGAGKPVAPIVDLLDINSDDAPVPTSSGGDLLQDLLGVDLSLASQQSGASQPSRNGTDVLLDLLSIGSVSASIESPVQRNSSTIDIVPQTNSLRLVFNFSKQPGNSQTTNIQATFTNLTINAAVPKFLQLHLDPAGGNTLPTSGKGSITQNMKVTNSQHGKKSLVMRIKIAYKINGKETQEEGQINNFPRDLCGQLVSGLSSYARSPIYFPHFIIACSIFMIQSFT